MKNTLKFDLVAGLSVFLVAIPLCLGIALACGAPLLAGLFAGIIGGVVIGILSDSHLSVSGPAAGLVAIVIVGISDLGSFPKFCAALCLAGVLQILMGIFKAGRLTKYLPHSVIEGMMAAIGIILIMKQYPLLLGRNELYQINYLIVGVSFSSLIILFLWDKFFSQKYKLIPGSLIVVVLGVIALAILQLSFSVATSYFVKIPSIDSLAQIQAAIQLPDWSVFSTNPIVFKTAIVLALVASIESLLCINAVERLDPQNRPTNKNRELLAQGTGNLLSGFIGGLPITSVIVRSSVNLNAGAKTKLSAIFHGFLILAVVLFGSQLMNFVPLVSLASVLTFTGYKLAHPKHLLNAWNTSRINFIAFLSTTLLVVKIDLLIGVISGIVIYYLLVAVENRGKITKSNTHPN